MKHSLLKFYQLYLIVSIPQAEIINMKHCIDIQLYSIPDVSIPQAEIINMKLQLSKVSASQQ